MVNGQAPFADGRGRRGRGEGYGGGGSYDGEGTFKDGEEGLPGVTIFDFASSNDP